MSQDCCERGLSFSVLVAADDAIDISLPDQHLSTSLRSPCPHLPNARRATVVANQPHPCLCIWFLFAAGT